MLKFGDLVMVVASITVISAVIGFPLELMFISAGLGFTTGQDIGVFLSFFLSALISGYIFTGKIWEARREAITKITVLWTALVSLIVTMIPAGLAHWGAVTEEDFQAFFHGTSWATLSNAERMSWEMIQNGSYFCNIFK